MAVVRITELEQAALVTHHLLLRLKVIMAATVKAMAQPFVAVVAVVDRLLMVQIQLQLQVVAAVTALRLALAALL